MKKCITKSIVWNLQHVSLNDPLAKLSNEISSLNSICLSHIILGSLPLKRCFLIKNFIACFLKKKSFVNFYVHYMLGKILHPRVLERLNCMEHYSFVLFPTHMVCKIYNAEIMCRGICLRNGAWPRVPEVEPRGAYSMNAMLRGHKAPPT
jgi:hypothetical protein